MENPFNPNQPADSRFFANRKRELSWISDFMLPSLHPASSGPSNIAILGSYGIGKTSLAYRLKVLSRSAGFPIVSTFVSCTTAYGTLLAFAEALVSAVADEVRQQLDWSEVLRQEIERWQIELRLPGGTALKRDRKGSMGMASTAEQLRHGLREIWNRYLGPKEAGAVIILDDVDALLALDPQALLILRAIFQDLHLAGARFGLVITAPTGLFEDIRDLTEPVTRFFERMVLSPFSWSDLADAVRLPLEQAGGLLRVPDETIGWLWDRTGGHPYFSSFIMRDLVVATFKQGIRVISVEDCEREWPAVRFHLENDRFAVDWASSSTAERHILRVISESSAAGPFRLTTEPKLNRSLISRLVRKGLLVRPARGVYELYHPLMAEFVLGQSREEFTGY